jgi:hypothetical protein
LVVGQHRRLARDARFREDDMPLAAGGFALTAARQHRKRITAPACEEAPSRASVVMMVTRGLNGDGKRGAQREDRDVEKSL